MFQLELVRQITFWCLFVVSAFLSVNLYVGLVDGIYNQGFMVVVAIVLEGIKILTLTMANTARWQVAQHKLNHMKETMLGHFSRLKRKLIRDPEILRDVLDAGRKQRRAVYLYTAYLLTAFLSISASFGYVRVTVENATTASLSVNNSDTISIYKDTLNQYDSQIKENEAVIFRASKSIDQYNAMIQQLDPLSDAFQRDRSTYQGNINGYQRLIDQRQQKNADLQTQKLALSDKIQGFKLQDVNTVKAVHKTMYQLMGETLGISDKVIMFVLLYMLAFILEVGLFICSPHFHKMDDDDNEKPKMTFKSVKEETLEKERKQKTTNVQGMETQVEAVPSPSRDSGHEPEIKALPEVERGNEKEQKSTESSGSNGEPLGGTEEFIDDNQLVLEPVPATTIEEKEEEIPVRVVEPIEERFVRALFNNNGHPFLKPKDVAGAEVGIQKLSALNIFDFLNRTKKNGFPMIEYRQATKLWYPNVTSEVALKSLRDEYMKKGSI